jgi:RNA recognition motif-containing protein
MNNRLYVGNLSFQTSEEEVMRTFSQVGEVTEATLVLDRETGRSRGFAFVVMASDADAQKAISELDGVDLDGRPLRVNIAEERKPRGGGFGGGGRGGGGYGGGGGGGRGGGGFGGGGRGGRGGRGGGGGDDRRNRW